MNVGSNKLTFKGMAKLMEDLAMGAESGSLKELDISDSIVDKEDSKQKQSFLDNLCTLIRKSRMLVQLNISKIHIRTDTLQNYLFFAI